MQRHRRYEALAQMRVRILTVAQHGNVDVALTTLFTPQVARIGSPADSCQGGLRGAAVRHVFVVRVLLEPAGETEGIHAFFERVMCSSLGGALCARNRAH